MAIVTVATSIIDRLIQLTTERERNKEKYFNNFIEPLYSDGEQIAKDYINLLAELIHFIGQANNCQEVVEWLEIRRAKFQPLRIKIRALIQDKSIQSTRKSRSGSLDLFRKGMWGLMKGGVSAVDDGHALTCEYGFGDHTVLDLINRTKKSVFDQHFRDTLIRQARRQQEAIEAAWKDVTYAYAEIKRTYLR